MSDLERNQQASRGARTLLATALVAVLAISAALCAGTAAGAGPNRYDVWSCRGPLGEPVTTTAWAGSDIGATGDVAFGDGCASGGALEVSLAGGRSFLPGVRGSLTLHAPAGTHIDSWTVWRSLAVQPAGSGPAFDYVAAITERGGTTVEQGCSSAQTAPFTCTTAGSESDPADPANEVDRPGTPVLSALELWVGCRSAVCDEPLAGPPARLRMYGSRVEVHDMSAPSRPELSGTLLAPGTIGGTATLVVESDDEGGGIAATTVSVDGEPSQTSAPAGPRGTCREPYTVLQPCPSAAARAFAIDTTRLTDGPHTVTGTVVDAAGNATAWGPVSFDVRQPASDDGDGGGGGTPRRSIPAERLRQSPRERIPSRPRRPATAFRRSRSRSCCCATARWFAAPAVAHA